LELKKANHPYVVKLERIIKAYNKDPDLWITFEFCDGDLRKVMMTPLRETAEMPSL